jgi:hypothetical protein
MQLSCMALMPLDRIENIISRPLKERSKCRISQSLDIYVVLQITNPNRVGWEGLDKTVLGFVEVSR